MSPVNVKLNWELLLLELELELPTELEALLEGRSIDQGTGTSFSPELEEVLEALLLLEAPGVLLLEAPGVLLLEPPGLLLPPLALELSDRTAKSIRPEEGFRMTSLIVPRVLPVESDTCAPVN